jgi:hypothetical protein
MVIVLADAWLVVKLPPVDNRVPAWIVTVPSLTVDPELVMASICAWMPLVTPSRYWNSVAVTPAAAAPDKMFRSAVVPV